MASVQGQVQPGSSSQTVCTGYQQTLTPPLVFVPLLIPVLSSLPVYRCDSSTGVFGWCPLPGRPTGLSSAVGAGGLQGGRSPGRTTSHGWQALPGAERSRRGIKHGTGFVWCLHCFWFEKRSPESTRGVGRVQGGSREDARRETDLPRLQLATSHTGHIASSSALERGKAAFFRTSAFTH